jgi:hypothetical protein
MDKKDKEIFLDFAEEFLNADSENRDTTGHLLEWYFRRNR